ncbi:MAG: hypothetical protein CML68_15350 [Rhodobacteraceae bacterium]|nr:hypothetical protein [Paracoccaceae bacterium]
MNAASRLCEIIAQGGKVSPDFYDDDRNFAAFKQHGFMREAGVLASVVCDQCSEMHSAPVVYDQLGHGYYCPELGLVELAPEQVIAYLPDLPFLIGKLADLLDCKQRKASPLRGQTWRIGAVTAASEQIMLFFHPRLQTEDDARQLQDALSRQARSRWQLVLASQGTWPMAEIATARLDEVVALDGETGALCLLVDPTTLVGAPRVSTGGRPSSYATRLKSLITARIERGEMVDGLNAEAAQLRAEFASAYPTETPPSLATVKRHVKAARTGS